MNLQKYQNKNSSEGSVINMSNQNSDKTWQLAMRDQRSEQLHNQHVQVIDQGFSPRAEQPHMQSADPIWGALLDDLGLTNEELTSWSVKIPPTANVKVEPSTSTQNQNIPKKGPTPNNNLPTKGKIPLMPLPARPKFQKAILIEPKKLTGRQKDLKTATSPIYKESSCRSFKSASKNDNKLTDLQRSRNNTSSRDPSQRQDTYIRGAKRGYVDLDRPDSRQVVEPYSDVFVKPKVKPKFSRTAALYNDLYQPMNFVPQKKDRSYRAVRPFNSGVVSSSHSITPFNNGATSTSSAGPGFYLPTNFENPSQPGRSSRPDQNYSHSNRSPSASGSSNIRTSNEPNKTGNASSPDTPSIDLSDKLLPGRIPRSCGDYPIVPNTNWTVQPVRLDPDGPWKYDAFLGKPVPKWNSKNPSYPYENPTYFRPEDWDEFGYWPWDHPRADYGGYIYREMARKYPKTKQEKLIEEVVPFDIPWMRMHFAYQRKVVANKVIAVEEEIFSWEKLSNEFQHRKDFNLPGSDLKEKLFGPVIKRQNEEGSVIEVKEIPHESRDPDYRDIYKVELKDDEPVDDQTDNQEPEHEVVASKKRKVDLSEYRKRRLNVVESVEEIVMRPCTCKQHGGTEMTTSPTLVNSITCPVVCEQPSIKYRKRMTENETADQPKLQQKRRRIE